MKNQLFGDPHLLHQLFVELQRGIVAHALLSVVHGGNLQNDGKVSPRANGNRNTGDIDAEDVNGLLLHAEAVVHLALHPIFKLDHKIHTLGVLDRSDTEEATDIHDADSAKLYVMSDHLGGRPNQRFLGNALDLICMKKKQII